MQARGKTFLNNSHQEGGSITWNVDSQQEERWCVVDGDITIRDCSKAITLDLSCETLKHIPKRIHKLDTLIHELSVCRAALVLAEQELIKRKRFYY